MLNKNYHCRPAPTQPARDVSNQRNDNMYLYSQSGVCLGYYLGTEASTALENLMLSGQLESVLLSLFPASSTHLLHDQVVLQAQAHQQQAHLLPQLLARDISLGKSKI